MNPDSLIDLITGYRKAKVLLVASSLDCFTTLSKAPLSARQVSARLSVSPRGAEILLDALVAMRLLRKRDGRYANLPISRKFLVRSSPAYLGDNLRYQNLIWDAWSELEHCVRKGRAVRPLEHWLSGNNGFASEYIRGMDNIARQPAAAIAEAVGDRSYRSLLDVGAGPGTYTRAFLSRFPALRATILDLPVTLVITREFFRADPELRDRTRLVAGNYRHASFGTEEHDLVLMSHITHDESPEVNERLARKCYKALRPGGRAIIHDFTVSEDRTSPEFGALFSVHMLAYTDGGRAYTRGEYLGWLKKAGFSRFETRAVLPGLRNATTLILATKT